MKAPIRYESATRPRIASPLGGAFDPLAGLGDEQFADRRRPDS
ncbi:hypothetical protein [Natrinema amylolyticum]|nr:hypothetical protein [Natrinema amylolyticum]